jgi:hypothetical protein
MIIFDPSEHTKLRHIQITGVEEDLSGPNYSQAWVGSAWFQLAKMNCWTA